MSDESTVTLSGPEGPTMDKKYEKVLEKLEIKLNNYLMKWIVIMIYY